MSEYKVTLILEKEITVYSDSGEHDAVAKARRELADFVGEAQAKEVTPKYETRR